MKTLDLGAVAGLRRQLVNGEAKAIREEARVSLAEIARVVGVTPQSVFRWENGTAMPGAGFALKYKEVLESLRPSTPESRSA